MSDPMTPPRESFRPGYPVPRHLVCVKTEYVNHKGYAAFERQGYYAVWFFDKEENRVEVHKVPDGLDIPNTFHGENVREYRHRTAAFLSAEDFVHRVRKAATFAYVLWPNKTPPIPRPEPWRWGKPSGALVRYPSNEPTSARLVGGNDAPRYKSYQFPPGIYRVISGPYMSPADAHGTPRAVVDMVCDKDAPGWYGEPLRHGTQYHNIAVSDLDVIPNWRYGIGTLAKFAELDPAFFDVVGRSAEHEFTQFEFDLWGEFLVDRESLGRFIEGESRLRFNPADFPIDYPVQHFADALHALAYHCGAAGPVFPSIEVRRLNHLNDEEITPGRIPGPTDYQ